MRKSRFGYFSPMEFERKVRVAYNKLRAGHLEARMHEFAPALVGVHNDYRLPTVLALIFFAVLLWVKE